MKGAIHTNCIFWFSERVKLNSCVVGIEEFDDHVKVRCVDGTEYKVCLPLLILKIALLSS